MRKGTTCPSESRPFKDERTGVIGRQITSHPSIHHHPFYYIPCFDDAQRWLVFVSHRSGSPQIFLEERASGKLIQLTDRPDLNEWSIHPSHDGQFVYFTAGTCAWRVSAETQQELLLASFDTRAIKETGMVGAAMGTTALSRDDRWWAIPARFGAISRLIIVDTNSGKAETILERDTIGHPQFHPDDASLLRYAGPYYDRIWIIHRDGTGNRLVYRRDPAKKEWIVHETWRPGTREILATNWPRGVIGVDVESGTVRQVCSFNAWHPMINRAGTLMVADTKNPDLGLQLFSPCRVAEGSTTLCYPEASNAGDHWNIGHCPYDDGIKDVYAPQHTHPHPNFSPDGRFVVFTSDRTGNAQLYEVELPG